MFDIKFLMDSPEFLMNGERSRFGQITLGSFQEKFVCSLEFWSIEKYEKHWIDSLLHLLKSKVSSCLITSISDPSKANPVQWWLLYPCANVVHIQNQLLFPDLVGHQFDALKPYIHIPERETTSEDGEPISEWDIDIEEIKLFFKL